MFKSFSHICVHKIPGVYLFKVKVIDSKYSVYKFGRSDDIGRRFREHAKKYGVDNVELTQFASVPENMLVEAERSVKDLTTAFKYEDGNNREHLKLSKRNMEQIRIIYELVHKKYTDDDMVVHKQEFEEYKEEVSQEHTTLVDRFNEEVEKLRLENITLKKQLKDSVQREHNITTEYESKMTIMREGFKVQMSKLRDEARLYMDSIKGVMDMFF
jgi:hypothetical protein